MQFNTYLFILLFLPFFLLGYYVLAKFSDKTAKGFLLFMSCIFYGYAGIEFLTILIGVMACNYAFVLLLNKADEKQCCRKFLLAVAVIMDVVLLLCFKYYNFFIENMNNWIQTDFNMKVIILPLGISFFTFQEISYIVEIYKGTTKTFSVWDYMIYILFFPKLLMGPLVMPQDLIPQINNRVNRQVNAENLMQGIRMFNIGLLKKALLVDTFSKVVYLDRQIAAERYVIQLILPCDNIRLFSFSNETDITMDLNNYKDTIHYGEWTNSLLLKHMNNDYGRLTSDNYEEYLRTEKLLYSNFDYNSLFKQMG